MISILGSIGSLFIHKEETKAQDFLIPLYDQPELEILDLIIYPCRGVEGIHLEEANVDQAGFEFDREWYLLKEDMEEKHIREPGRRWVSFGVTDKIGQVGCKIVTKERTSGLENEKTRFIVFSHKEHENDLWIDTTYPATEELFEAYNYDDQLIKGFSEGQEAREWFSTLLEIDVVLVRSIERVQSSTHKMDLHYQYHETDTRRSGHKHAAIHIVNQKSVDKLQSLCPEKGIKVTAEAFRPNIVISGIEADEEDNIRELVLTSNDLVLRMMKLCIRCKTPTFNKETGHKNPSTEPVKTLRSYKMHEHLGIVFGIFVQIDTPTIIKLSDKIKYTKKAPVPIVYETSHDS